MVNTEKLNDLFKDTGFRKDYIASRLGMTRQNLSLKINNKAPFSAGEMKAMKNIFSISDKTFMEIFFAEECSVKEHEEESV